MGIIFLLWLTNAAVCDAIFRKSFNWVAFSGGVIAFFSAIIYPEFTPAGIGFKGSILGGGITFFVFLFFYILKIMGAGDVKFATALGLWVGWELMLYIWALSCVFAVFHGLFSRSNIRYFFYITAAMNDGLIDGKRKFIPYVTYLCIATVVVMLYKN